jgi:hypothetical protein
MSRSANAAATILTVEGDPIVQEDLRPDDDQHLKVMIDALVRAGCSEREIVAAVERACDR